MSAVETVTINELIVEYNKLTRQNLCIDQDDAMGCYDRIIRGHSIFNSRKFEIPDNICKVYGKTHDNMTFKTQLNNRISKIEYKSTDRRKLHGARQGAGNGGTKWSFIGIPMIEVVEEVASCCKLILPSTKEE